MDRRPGRDNEFVLLADTLDFGPKGTAGGVEWVSFQGHGLVAGIGLHRADQPLVALPGGSGHDLLDGLQLLLGLLLLILINDQLGVLDVVDDGRPGQGSAGGVLQAVDHLSVGDQEEQAIGAVAWLGAVLPQVVADKVVQRLQVVLGVGLLG